MPESNKKPSPLVRVGGKYGAFCALVLVAANIVLYYFDRHPLLINIFFDLRIIIFGLFLVFVIKEFKEEINSGVLHFWQGMSLGLLTFVLAAFLTSIVLWIFARFVEPGFVTEFIRLSAEQLGKNKDALIESLGQERYDVAMAKLPSTSAGNLAFDYFLKSIPIGFTLTLILSIILRSQPKSLHQNGREHKSN